MQKQSKNITLKPTHIPELGGTVHAELRDNEVHVTEIQYGPTYILDQFEYHMSNLHGCVLTTIDTALSDPVQRDAAKSILKQFMGKFRDKFQDDVITFLKSREILDPNCDESHPETY